MKQLEKRPLFVRKREGLFFGLLLFALLGLNLLVHYHGFTALTTHRFFDTQGTVLAQYQKLNKKKKPYTVLKLSGNGLTFYTTTKEELKPLMGRQLSLTLITDRVTFPEYLGTFYAPSFNLALLPWEPGLKEALTASVASQHESKQMGELYNALFFAAPVGPQLREGVTDWGIAHLIALSGYHLGFLGAILLWLLGYPYTYFQARFFPYRNRLFDLSLVSAALLFGYLLFTGAPPSLIRAYGMLAMGLFLFHRWIDLFSFSTLLITLALLVVLIPSLFFSVGFWFSAAGVFYIYLFLHHFKALPPWAIFLFLNLFIFVAMMPVVHFVFAKFTYLQLLSPLLTLLFALFYPLSMVLHLLGAGGMADTLLSGLFAIRPERLEIEVPLWFLGLYLGLSLGAVFRRELFYLLGASGGGFLLYALL